jgi:glycosyltransferase involved in cell wall biosynthesis
MKNKILIIVNDYAKITGGQDSSAFQDFLLLKGFYPSIKLVTGVGPIDNSLRNVSPDDHICLHGTDIANEKNKFWSFINGLFNLNALFLLLKVSDLYKKRTIIFHFHSFTKYFSPLVPWFLLIMGFKVVFTINDYFLNCPNGALFNFKSNKICKLSPLSFKCFLSNCDSRSYYYKLWRFLRSIIFFNNFLGINRFAFNYVFVSAFSKNIFIDNSKGSLSRNVKSIILPNPTNIISHQRVQAESNETFLFVGRLVESKGVFLFAESIIRIGAKGLIIGDGPAFDLLKKNYPQITFAGWRDILFIRESLLTARALFFPSLWYEAQPLVPNEALALGVPVVTSNVNATVELVLNNVNGIHFDINVLNDLDRCINLLSDDEFVKILSINAFKMFQESDLNPTKRATMYADFYNSL